MIFEPPKLGASEEEAVERVDLLRHDLRLRVHAPRRWLGGLRRLAFAKAVQGSNSIEGYNASVDDVMAIVEGEEPLDASTETKLALQGYRDAMTYVLQLAEDEEDVWIDAALIKSLHYMLIKHDLSKRPGRWRAGAISVLREPDNILVYEGPHIDLVPDLMNELTGYLHQREGHVLVRSAMAHLNLAMVHPFADGNGRMARILQSLVLTNEQILSPVFCSIEEWLGRNTEVYYDVLAEVGQGSWHPKNDARPWLRFCLNAHYQQALTLAWRIRAYETLWERCEEIVEMFSLPERSIGPLMLAAQGHVIRNSTYRTAVKDSDGVEISFRSAGHDLRVLVGAGLLSPRGQTKARVYLGTGLLRNEWNEIRQTQPKPEMMDLFPRQQQLTLS